MISKHIGNNIDSFGIPHDVSTGHPGSCKTTFLLCEFSSGEFYLHCGCYQDGVILCQEE